MKVAEYQIPIPWEEEKPCLHRMIRQLQTRPGAYLGSKAITPLFHFLNGYQAAERALGVCWRGNLFPLDFQFMHSFSDLRLGTKCACAGWCRNILTACHGDEEKALALFFELYREFTQVGMKRYWKAGLAKENIEQNDSMEHGYAMKGHGPEPVYKEPIAVYVLELTIPAYLLLVETTAEVYTESLFFSSAQEAKGKKAIPRGAEGYFGKIDTWEEFAAESLWFDKVIRVH